MAADLPSTIGECSKRCLVLFSLSADAVWNLQRGDSSRIRNSFEDEFARFNLWASNIGVFADVHVSLDFRVRELPDVAELFLRQLDTIECRLNQLHEDLANDQFRENKAAGEEQDFTVPVKAAATEKPDASFEEWDPAEILQSIHESIDWLHRLSNLVRKASFINQNRRAKNFLLRDSEGNESKELTDEMTAGLRNLYDHVIKRNAKGLVDNLTDRLIETMVMRHKRILYRRSRQISYAISQVHYTAQRAVIPGRSEQLHSLELTSLTQEPKALKVGLRTTRPQDKATTVDVETFRKRTAPSRLSRASSTPLKQQNQMLIHPAPKAAVKGKDFVCPYCCVILQSCEASNPTTWAKHVKKDLDAYICVFEDCDSPYEIYSSSKEWLSHMSIRHRMRWQCFATDHELLLYEGPEEFENHMKSDHPGSFPDDQLPFIVEISAQPVTPTLKHCPFCSETAGDLEEHVGQHLREFALHSLPWPDYTEDGSQDGSQSDGMSSNRGTRETAKEDRDSLPPLIFDNDMESEEMSNNEPKRLDLYEYLPQIATQHEPLHNNLELLKDELIATFARSRYGVDTTEALVQLFSASARERERVFADVYIHSDDRLSVDHLPAAAQAPFDASNKQDDPLCLEGTRTEVLKQIRAWTYGEERSCIFWLNGMEGTGKSTVARTISREFSNRGDLGASFFFARGGGDVAHAGMFFMSIAKQLAIARPSVKPFILQAVQHQPDIASRSQNDQWTKLIAQPLRKIPLTPQHTVLVIVVDALDECDNDNDMKGIIAALAQAQDIVSVKLRIIVTSRPETLVRLGFKKMPEILHRDLLLYEQPREVVDADICLFFYNAFEEIRDVHCLADDWPSIDTVNQLVHLSAGLFVFAATICRFIQESEQSAEDSLKLFMSSNYGDGTAACDDFGEAKGATTLFLDSMYSHILERSRPYTRYKAAQPSPHRETLGAIAALDEALPVGALASLLCLRESDILQHLSRLHSVIRVPTDSESSIHLFNASFRDFLFDRRRCRNPDFVIDEQEAHSRLLQQCIHAMQSILRRDLCDLQHPEALISEVTQSRINARIPLHVQYACRYWFDHSEKGYVSLDDDGPVDHFLRKYCLYWLEVMGIVSKVPEAMDIMMRLESLIDVKIAPKLYVFVKDTLRFMHTFSQVLAKAPLQIYSAGLMFSPSNSVFRRTFNNQAMVDIEVRAQLPDEWNACIQTLEGHSDVVSSVVFSPDGSRLASSSKDETVRVWDVQTGQCQHTLEGHLSSVTSVVFSPDRSRLASGSWDKTVRVWDVQTGQCEHTLEGHSRAVSSVVFSPDGSRLVSGSDDETMRVWDVQTGQCQHTLEGHSDVVSSVVFSPDGSRLASGSSDKTLRVWDVQTGQCEHTLKGHSRAVSTVVFSPDGSRLASGSEDKTLRVWDVQTGQYEHILEGHSDGVSSVVFSPDGSRLASGSDDETVRVWDVQTGLCEYTLEGHSDGVSSVVFSPDGSRLASGSDDETVQVWDVQTGQCEHTLEGHSRAVSSVVFSPDGSRLASGSDDETVRVWDVQTGQCKHTLEGHSRAVSSVVFSPDGSRLASGSDDETVRVWDVQTGQCEHTLNGHSDKVSSVAFSPDGSRVASGSEDKTVRVWDVVSSMELMCYDTGAYAHDIGFSDDGMSITVNGALLSVPSQTQAASTAAASLKPSLNLPSKLSIIDDWIISSSERILWLPPEYRPGYWVSNRDTIVIGSGTGRVTFVRRAPIRFLPS